MIGKVISHYEIVEKLGQGGMGIVYKALDQRLSRFVAMKMLSPEVASDNKRKMRLILEARAASTLNHPNICTIHEIDEVDGMLFVVMEFLSGHTLAAEIAKGPIKLEKVVDFALQASEALQKAHSCGIIHRDIKPSNILITDEGRVKILDFGLARLEAQENQEMWSAAPTLQERLTETGQIVGTVPFMSPEQLRGAPAGKLTDLFSFGVVVYAMLTGRLPFEGNSIYALMSSILNTMPTPVSRRNPGVPEAIDAVINKAIAKNPNHRHESIEKFVSELKEAVDQLQTNSRKAATTSAHRTIITQIKERRHVTIAVSRITAYQELIENLPAADWDDLVKNLRNSAEQLAESHGDIAVQMMDDQIIFVCGIPTAHEDDGVRAIRTVLQMNERIKEVTWTIGNRIGQTPQLQTGISSGVALVELGQDKSCRVTGNVFQLASRLSDEAKGEEILITPECRRLIDPYFEIEPAQSVTIKGSTLVPFRVMKESGVRSRLEASGKAGFTPFAGRQGELAMLHTAFEKARVGEGHLVTLFGEAGIGKSRLLLEFKNHLQAEAVLVLQGRCQSDRSGISYFPFVDMLRDLLQLPDTPPNAADSAVKRIREIHESLDDFVPIYLYLLGIKEETRAMPKHLQGDDLRLAIREALSAIFTVQARKMPAVLMLEDWHWADDASQEVLRSLVEMIPGCSILIVVAARPESASNLMSFPNHISIHLAPLDPLLSTSIIQWVLSVQDFPDDLAKVIHDRTGGNPFFLEEICFALKEEGRIRISEGKVYRSGPIDQFRLPETVEAVIQARIDRLGWEDQELLRLAAVAGRQFTRGVLQKVLGEGPAILRSLENLKALGLIHQVGVVPEAVYRFKHALTQQVAYESMLQHRRKELHGMVGRAMEELYPSRAEENANLLAQHFSQADDWEKAIHYGLLSAQQAEDVGQFSEALDLREKIHTWCLHLADDEKRQELIVENLFSQEHLSETLGKRERQQQIIEILLEKDLGRAKLAEVYRRQGDLFTLLARLEAAEEALLKSLDIAKKLDDSVAQRNALRSLGFMHWHRGNNAESAEYNKQVLELDRELGDLPSIAGDLTSLANTYRSLGEYERALESLQEALAIYEQRPDPRKQSATLHVAGVTYRDLGRIDKALECLEKGLEVSKQHQIYIQHGQALVAVANIHLQQGNIDQALHFYQESLASSRKAGYAQGLVQSLGMIAQLLHAIGRKSEARAYFEESAGLFAQLGDSDSEARLRITVASIYEEENKYEEALKNWEKVTELVPRDDSQRLEAMEGMARVSRLCGQPVASSLHYYQEAMRIAEQIEDKQKTAAFLNSLGILEWSRQGYEAALEYYEKALAIFNELQDRVHSGLILNSIGVTLMKLGRWTDAQAYLERAIETNVETKENLLEGHSWAALGDVRYQMGDLEEATRCYETSLEIRKKVGDRRGEGWMLYNLARMRLERGSTSASKEALLEAARIAAENEDRKLQAVCNELQNYQSGGHDA